MGRTYEGANVTAYLHTIRHLRAWEWLSRSPSRPMHPGWLRCSSVTYLGYAPSSRLAIRAPRPRSSTDLAIPRPLQREGDLRRPAAGRRKRGALERRNQAINQFSPSSLGGVTLADSTEPSVATYMVASYEPLLPLQEASLSEILPSPLLRCSSS